MTLPGIGVFGTGQSTLTIVPYLKKEVSINERYIKISDMLLDLVGEINI